MTKFKEITHAQMHELRKEQFIKQGCQCPILNQIVEFKDTTFDHKHKRKDDPIGICGKGLLRGVIHFQANVIEGKIARLYKRYGLDKFISLPDLLRNIAKYIENPPMAPIYVHPDERQKPDKITIAKYNMLCKYYLNVYPRRKKLPEYPVRGKITKEFEQIIKNFEKWFKEECEFIKENYFVMYPRRKKLPVIKSPNKEFDDILVEVKKLRNKK